MRKMQTTSTSVCFTKQVISRCRKMFPAFLFILCLSVPGYALDSFAPVQLQLDAADRILILAPHPDDEVLGCAGVIKAAHAKGAAVKIVFLTYGDNNEWAFLLYNKHPVFMPKAVQGMGEVRYKEAHAAAVCMSVDPETEVFLGYPDFGTMNMWYQNWGKQTKPFKSMLTKVDHVPYKNAFRPQALYRGEEVVQDLKTIIAEFKPTKIFVSHPADHNGDHKALFLYARVALLDVSDTIRPEVFAYLIHWVGWPKPQGFLPLSRLIPPRQLLRESDWVEHMLDSNEVKLKFTCLKKHASQLKSSPAYLRSFVHSNEVFEKVSSLKIPVLSSDENEIQSSTLLDAYDMSSNMFLKGLVAKQTISCDQAFLTVTITLTKPLAQQAALKLYVFGYRHDVAFEYMPKLSIRLGPLFQSVRDKNKIIDARKSGVKISRKGATITVKIPRQLMYYPRHLLLSAYVYMGTIPFDFSRWQELELH